ARGDGEVVTPRATLASKVGIGVLEDAHRSDGFERLEARIDDDVDPTRCRLAHGCRLSSRCASVPFRSDAKVLVNDLRPPAQRIRIALPHDAPFLDHVMPVGEPKQMTQIL